MEDEAVLAVEDAEQQEIPPAEVERGPDEERQAVVAALQPQRPLVGSAEQPGGELPGDAPAAALELLAGERLGVAQVLLQIEQDRVFLLVPLLERRPQAADPARGVDPGVLLQRTRIHWPGKIGLRRMEKPSSAISARASSAAISARSSVGTAWSASRISTH